MPRDEQLTHVFFTLNEGEEKLPQPGMLISKLREAEPNIDYVKFQLERGEEKARNHYQGAFHLSRRRTFNSLKSAFHRVGLRELHFERCKSWLASLEYVGKPDTRVDGPWEAGLAPGGRRDPPGRDQKPVYPPRPDPKARREVHLITGPPGCGKTYAVRTLCENRGAALYTVPDRAKQSGGRWIGSYGGQPAVLFDEFKFSDFSVNTWKLLLDAYDINVTSSMGGKTCLWQPSHIFLITNSQTEFAKMIEDTALRRRLSRVDNYYMQAPPYDKETQTTPNPRPFRIRDPDYEVPSDEETEDISNAPWPEDPPADD